MITRKQFCSKTELNQLKKKLKEMMGWRGQVGGDVYLLVIQLT